MLRRQEAQAAQQLQERGRGRLGFEGAAWGEQTASACCCRSLGRAEGVAQMLRRDGVVNFQKTESCLHGILRFPIRYWARHA
jgi:hypothetical protein